MVTVILHSDGFADMIERGEFIRRISDQARRIVSRARQAKADAIGAERRLDGLERRQQNVTAIAQKRRDEAASRRITSQLQSGASPGRSYRQ